MLSAAGAGIILIETTVPHRFCEAQLLPELIRYLGTKAQATPEVIGELERRAQLRTHAGLRLLGMAGWPTATDPLPLDLRLEFERLRRAAQQPSDHPNAHIGEISTVLMANHLVADLVVIDDEFGKALAKKKRLPRLSTAQLALEMVAEGALDESQGLTVFNLSSDHAGERIYRARLAERQAQAGGHPT